MSEVNFIANVDSFDEAEKRREKLEQDTAKTEKKLHQNEMRAFAFAAAVLHIGNLTANIIGRAFEGTAAAEQAQQVAQGINIASTELGIVRMTIEAAAQFAMHNYLGSGRLIALAGMMQLNLLQQQYLLAAAKDAERRIKAVKESFERWS